MCSLQSVTTTGFADGRLPAGLSFPEEGLRPESQRQECGRDACRLCSCRQPTEKPGGTTLMV